MRPLHYIVMLSSGHQVGAVGQRSTAISPTPNLGRLAAAGTVFDAAFATSPIASVARGACTADRWLSAFDACGYLVAPPGIDPPNWIADNASRNETAPGFLLVELPSLDIAPSAITTCHHPADMPVPRLHPTEGYPRHPWVERWHRTDPLDDRLDDAARQRLLATYFDRCIDLDRQVGDIVGELDKHGLWPTTRVIYASTTGHNLGARGIWRTPTLYDDHIAVPLLMAGPGIPAGRRCRTPVSIADLATTIAPSDPPTGRSLFDIATAPDETTRTVVASCPGPTSNSNAAMIRDGRFKYIAYEGFEPELFDLAADPGEEDNLARSPAHTTICARLERRLRAELQRTEHERIVLP